MSKTADRTQEDLEEMCASARRFIY